MAVELSICIPTWEQNGYGKKYLKEMFETIKGQTFQGFEVIISDHSANDDIKNLVGEYDNVFDIRYFKNVNQRGNSPANTNYAIKQANGNIIKTMFQDDLFVNTEALEKIYECFKQQQCSWLVSGCNHTNDGKTFNREMIPSWNDRILLGNNTISSPSVLAFRNEGLFFDENLVMLMDCEYYYQLYRKYGLPTILKEILVSNRLHTNQISSQYRMNINDEIRYVKNKHLW